jgi:hypothetical protein
MKTELQHKESIFGADSPLTPKTIRVVKAEAEAETKDNPYTKSVSESNMDLENLLYRMNMAIDKNDVSALPWLQAEIQMRSFLMLKDIDWKLWEIYSKFVI